MGKKWTDVKNIYPWSRVILLDMPGVDNTNNDAGDEVLEDETDDGVEKSAMFGLPIL